jgi:alcohol dehydrogenase
MTRPFTLQSTPRLRFGCGLVAELAAECRRLGAARVLLVTDPGLIAAGLAARVQALLAAADLAVATFAEVEADPSLQTAQACAEAARAHGADLLVGLGGGSPMDTAKVAAVLLTNETPLDSMFGIDLVPRPGVPVLLVPTTAGTGSEATPIAILSDHDEQLKKGVVSPHLFPRAAIVDPELGLGVPPAVTAASGIDAMLHAVEAYTSKNANPVSDVLGLRAIRLIHGALERAFKDGRDLAARTAMAEGAMLAGMAFANAGVTAVHAFAYPIGAEFQIPHGVANSLMMGVVLRFNADGAPGRFAELADALGVPDHGDAAATAHAVIDALVALARAVRIPEHLADFGVTEADLPRLAAGVMKVTRLLANNPRPLTEADALRLYRAAL